jgi:GTP-binding protein LepA
MTIATLITFKAPLANMLTDFYDNLKSSTSGYGSFNYELSGYKAEDLSEARSACSW